MKQPRPAGLRKGFEAAPLTRAGRGLKLDKGNVSRRINSAAPLTRAGRGLKLQLVAHGVGQDAAAPLTRAGRGLKHVSLVEINRYRAPPRSPERGAD